MKPRFLIAALGLAYASHSATTYAQAFLSDPRLVEGRGVKAGDFELHPGIAAEGGYDSNYFQRSGEITQPPGRPGQDGRDLMVNEPVIDAWRLRITPSFSFASRGGRAGEEGGGPVPALTLNGRLAASYNALFAADSENASQVSGQDNVSGTAGLALGIFPGRTWGGDLSADYNRIIEASNDPDTNNAYKRDIVRGGAGIMWRPGGGLFSWRLGYQATATLFETGDFSNLNNLRHSFQLAGSWKFLPRTALLYRGNISWLDYTDSRAPTTLGGGQTFDTQIGINGLISNYFGVLGMIGWAGSFYEPQVGAPQNYDSVVGQAQLTWYPSPQRNLPQGESPVGLSAVAIGYTRNFGASYLGTYFQRDRGYLNTTYFFGQRFVLNVSGGLSHITRPASFFEIVPPATEPAVQSPGSEENRVDATAFLEYRISGTVGINTTFRYDTMLEHHVYAFAPPPSPAGMPPGGDDLYFHRYQVYLGVRWFL
jgi:hypothetical protein